MPERSETGHCWLYIDDVIDCLRDRWARTPGLRPVCTVQDVLEDVAALGCERAAAMLERERRRAT